MDILNQLSNINFGIGVTEMVQYRLRQKTFLSQDNKCILVCFLILVLLSPVFAAGKEIPYGPAELDSKGWTHTSKLFNFPCSGAADLEHTPCYKKNPPGDGEFQVAGQYSFVAFTYSCKTAYTGFCWMGCEFKAPTTQSIGNFQIEGGAKSKINSNLSQTTYATLFKGPFTGKYVCGPCGHGEYVFYVEATNCKVDVYTKTFMSCDDFCSSATENSNGEEKNGACVCYCDEGYTPKEVESKAGNRAYKKYTCKSDISVIDDLDNSSSQDVLVPPITELEKEFTDDEVYAPHPEYLYDEATLKEALKNKLGIDLDDFEKGSGNGKKAFVISSTQLDWYDQLWTSEKEMLSYEFYRYLGYDVSFVYNTPTNDIYKKIVEENPSAISYFGHGAQPSFEGDGAEDVKERFRQARINYYVSQGHSFTEANALAAQNNHLNLEMFYSHTCHSADPGFQDLANFMLKTGGVYYGEEGILWGWTYPDHIYAKTPSMN